MSSYCLLQLSLTLTKLHNETRAHKKTHFKMWAFFFLFHSLNHALLWRELSQLQSVRWFRCARWVLGCLHPLYCCNCYHKHKLAHSGSPCLSAV